MKYALGDVIRLAYMGGVNWPFCDCVIVRENDNGTFTLHRPYAYASETSRNGSFGFESLDFTAAQLDRYERIDTGRI